jgi:hypothetical protein
MIKSPPYPLLRAIREEKYDHEMVEELMNWAIDSHRFAQEFEGKYLFAQFHQDRLHAENEFLIRWINSRIQDRFNDD